MIRPSLKNQKPPQRVLPSEDDVFGMANITALIIELNQLKFRYTKAIEELENNSKKDLKKEALETKNEVARLKMEIKSEADQLFKKLQKELSRIEKLKVEKGDPGEDGEDFEPTEEDLQKIAKMVEVPVVEKIIEKRTERVIEKPITIEKTNTVENKFTFENFKDFFKKLPQDLFDELFKPYENRIRSAESKITIGGGQGSWKQYQLSGAIDSNNRVFTFAGDAPAEYSERVFLNYAEQNPFTDYTISGNTVTYTTAPDSSLSGLPHIIRCM